jgi:uncharacterized membrane protein
MKNATSFFRTLFLGILLLQILPNVSADTIEQLEIYSPYTRVSVTPGSTVNYSIDVINNGAQTINENILLSNMPRSWSHSLTAGGLNINRLAVLPGEKKTLNLKVEVPYQVKKGNYTFYAKVGDSASLPLTITVSSAGSNESELSCDQKNMEGTSKSNFSFSAVLKNKTPNQQQYALMAAPPRGWSVAIKPNYKQATSTEVDANGTKNITYEVKAPSSVKAGTYKIPVKAVSGSTSAEIELEVVITGTYEMAFNTPSGLLSARITANDEKKIELAIRNTGSTKLEKIELSASKPKNWEVTFDNKTIASLDPGKSVTVFATIKPDKKAIPGDYVTNISARTSETDQTLVFRVMVKTSMLMGWIGVLVILLAIGGVGLLIKKFGRR